MSNARQAIRDIAAEVGTVLTAPDVGSDAPDTALATRLLNAAGQDAAARKPWPKLMRREVLSRIGPGDFPAISSYALPADYGWMSTECVVVAVTDEPSPVIYDPVSSLADWEAVNDDRSSFILFNDRIHTRDDAGSVHVTFVSNHWVSGAAGSSDRVGGNEDTFKLPYRLLLDGAVWRWLRRNGDAHREARSDWEADIELLYSQLTAKAVD